MKHHVINLERDHWTLMHPLSCRPNLFDCLYNKATLPEEPPETVTGEGIYEVTLNESLDELVIQGKLSSLPRNELDALRGMLGIVGADGYWDQSAYTRGFYNGLEQALAVLEGREPEPRDTPKNGYLDGTK